MMFAATGSGDWFDNEERRNDLADGTLEANNIGRSSWGCGESQSLKGLVVPGQAALAGMGAGLKLRF
jgi:hypothetical protein